MSNTVVTGSGLRFELSDRQARSAAAGGPSQRSASVIASALDDDFLDSLMDDDGPAAEAAAAGVASASVATFLFDSGLGAHMSAFDALRPRVQSVDDLYRVGDFARVAGLSAADAQTLTRALARRARDEALRAADEGGSPPAPPPPAPPPAASAESNPQRPASVIESALDDDFLDSLMDDGPAAISVGPAVAGVANPPRSVSDAATASAPSAAPVAATATNAGTRAASVIASALDDDFLDSLMDDAGPAARPPPDDTLPAFLGRHGLAQYREGLADLGVGSVDELFEVAAGELERAPVRMSQTDVRTLQAALAMQLMRGD